MKNLVSVFSLIYYSCKILLIVLLFNWWMDGAFANERPGNLKEIEEMGELIDQRDLYNVLGDENFEFKETIKCTQIARGQDPYLNRRAPVRYFVCPDGTPSFNQPDSTGNGGWNGYCGQTAVSNLTAMLCKRYFTPETVDSYATDVTPGNLPGTNLRALKRIFTESYTNVRSANPCPKNGKWKAHSPWTEQGLINGVKRALFQGPGKVQRKRSNGSTISITPVGLLIGSGIDKLHWVTVVDFHSNPQDRFGCDVVMNTWGNQKVMTCENLARYANTMLLGHSYHAFER
jgi:hypothetical protein